MQLPDIFLLAGILILLRLIPIRPLRHAGLIICSCVFLFVFQPALPIRALGFTLPVLTVGLTLCVYSAFSVQNPLRTKQNLIESALILVTLILIAATRFISYSGIVTASRPPQLRRVLPLLAAAAAICALLNVQNKYVALNENAHTLSEKMVREAIRVANASGCDFDIEAEVAAAFDVAVKTGENRCSMLQDFDRKGITEIKIINGAVVAEGKKVGIETPYNEAIMYLVMAHTDDYLANK